MHEAGTIKRRRDAGKRGRWLALALALALWCAAPALAGRYVYVVEDGQGGVKMYDALPSDLAGRGYRVVDEHGVTVKVVPPGGGRGAGGLSDHDRALLATFANEGEIEIARDRQLATLEGLIRLNERNLPLYEANLAELEGRARDLEAAGRPVPETLRQDIRRIRAQVEERRAFIAEQRREMDRVRARYEADLRRFRELKRGAR